MNTVPHRHPAADRDAAAADLRRRAATGPIWAIGLMSGTSLDGIDAALVRTDGTTVAEVGAAATVPYDAALRERLRALLGVETQTPEVAEAARDLTLAHAQAVRQLIARAAAPAGEISVVGFHGQTIFHRPEAGITRQIGDGQLLADLTGLPVVSDFRTADVAAGGEGAPLVPLFHRALAAGAFRRGEGGPGVANLPLAVLNLGGVGNVTWIGSWDDDGDLLAFDTGPGNALLDDWVHRHTGQAYDDGGRLAATGQADEAKLAALLADPFFARCPPKSLDRNHFDMSSLEGLPVADGAATLAAFTAGAVGRARDHLPAAPRRWLVAGGGRHNAALMAALRAALAGPVDPVEAVGWDGDALEAQAFGYLAVRSLRGLPLSLPRTTGVAMPMPGGRLAVPAVL